MDALATAAPYQFLPGTRECVIDDGRPWSEDAGRCSSQPGCAPTCLTRFGSVQVQAANRNGRISLTSACGRDLRPR
jgi:hypothetical protein